MKVRFLFLIPFMLGFTLVLHGQSEEATPPALAIVSQEPAPNTESASATPHVSIQFADPSQVTVKDQLLLELDRVDVSALAQLADGKIQFDPTTPLAPGSHEVRLTGKLADGRAFQEITWSFTVAQANNPRSWTFGLTPSITWEHGFQQQGPNPNQDRVSSNIALNGQSTAPIQTTITSNLQGQDTPGPSGKDFDLANFNATLSTRNGSTIGLWDVQPNFDALVVSNLARRGFSFQQKLPFLNSGVDVFLVRAETLFGIKHGFGLADSNQRLDGFSYFFSPLKVPEKLTLRALYFRGENAIEQGFNFGGVTRGSKGDAYGFALSSSIFSNQMRAELFGAWSNFDFNASDGFSGNKDKAFLGRLSYTPTPAMFHGRSSAFLAQLEVQNLGTFFKSLGNPFLVSDRRGVNLTSSWNWGSVGFTGGASRFHDNVDDLAILPTVDNTAYSGGFNITPQSTTGPPKFPAVSFTAARSEQQSIHAVAAFLAVHNIVDTYGSVISLARNPLNLTLNLSYAVNRDLNNRVPDTDSKNATLGAFFAPRPSWSFGPSVSFTRTADRDAKVDTDLWTYSLTSGFPIFPNALTLDGQLSYSSTEASNFLNRSSTFSGTAQLSFLVGQLFKTKGRQALSMRVSYNQNFVEAPLIVHQRGLEVFGALDISWPF